MVPSGASPAVNQPQWGEGPVGQGVLVHHRVAGRHHPVHHQRPVLCQRCKHPSALPDSDLRDPRQTPFPVPVSRFTPRHQQTLSWAGVAGIHSPEGATSRHRPLRAVPLGYKQQVGGGERELCPGLCLQGVEEFPGHGVTVQEGQDFTEHQLTAAVAA